MNMPVKTTGRGFSYKDYISWPDNERWELIEGVAYDMSPAPSRRHQKILRELLKFFATYLTGKTCEVYVAPFDVRLLESNEKDEDVETVVQPDLVVVCDRTKLDDKGCRGVPDLIIEILSPFTAKKDMEEKFILYERVGVKEYWIVDPNNNAVMVYKLEEGTRYGRYRVYTPEDSIKVGIFEDFSIAMKEVFAE